MPWTAWFIVALALLFGSWLLFDGTRAFVTGNYVTPSSGDYAGKLGPWASAVSAVGLDPFSPLVKGLHVALGLLWLAAAVAFALRIPWARPALTAAAVASLWYLPTGPVVALLQLVLLWRQ